VGVESSADDVQRRKRCESQGKGLARRDRNWCERWTNAKLSRRTYSPRYGLRSCRGESAGAVKRPRERSPTQNPYRTIRSFCIAVRCTDVSSDGGRSSSSSSSSSSGHRRQRSVGANNTPRVVGVGRGLLQAPPHRRCPRCWAHCSARACCRPRVLAAAAAAAAASLCGARVAQAPSRMGLRVVQCTTSCTLCVVHCIMQSRLVH
jgi:hypothetical protein